jgi:hypothetical protein
VSDGTGRQATSLHLVAATRRTRRCDFSVCGRRKAVEPAKPVSALLPRTVFAAFAAFASFLLAKARKCRCVHAAARGGAA